MENVENTAALSFEDFKKEVLSDFRIASISREASLLGRKEVLTGKAKFGIFGDGKEIPQIAMAKAFKNGDIRSGYYRDQTFVFATGMGTLEQFFAQLYANTDEKAEPHSAGRQMNGHFASHFNDDDGNWLDVVNRKNTAADSSPTASQMCRAVGLALASKKYRAIEGVETAPLFSNNGDEVTFCTIGDASTSEGVFWEAINAAGVMQIPMAVSVWDDGYGISVPKKYQTTKESISEVLSGFQSDKAGEGYDIYKGKAWDYAGLVELYTTALPKIRAEHKPAIFHIEEVTQPQGHSTSGSHERYKSPERLAWEKEYDCIAQMRKWLIESALATEEELQAIEQAAKKEVRDAKKAAWTAYTSAVKAELNEVIALYTNMAEGSDYADQIVAAKNSLAATMDPFYRDIIKSVKTTLRLTRFEHTPARQALIDWKNDFAADKSMRFNTHLHSESARSIMNVAAIPAEYTTDSVHKNGYEVLNTFFEAKFNERKDIVAFGEDLGKIGDVNQGFAGLQEKFGEDRIFDCGIRETTIMGQGLGLAMRGFRPIAEIQYLDYLIYGLQPLVDDLATLQYRTRGRQKAPMIIRTRGHRLEGIWHTGSPMGMILHALRGVNVCVPRNMVQAAGMYNTLLASDEPGLVIECLNGYRLKELVPNNLTDFSVQLGVPEVVKQGNDVTVVTYGSTLRVAEEAVALLDEVGISVELIDVQTLIPFDVNHSIVESLEKTNKVVFLDEDVPGGAVSYMMQQVLEEQEGYYHLDSKPVTITAHAHRAAYGSDGDYFCKPNAEDIFESIYELIHESDPESYPMFY